MVARTGREAAIRLLCAAMLLAVLLSWRGLAQGEHSSESADGILDRVVLHYSFDDDQGRRVTDCSGRGNHGQIRSGTYVSSGKVGRAMAFNGEGDYIDIGDHPDTQTEVFTLSTWIKTNDMRERWQSIVSFEAQSYAVSILPNGHVHYGWQNVKQGVEGHSDVRSGDWVFVVVTRDDDHKACIYVNGELEGDLVCDFSSRFNCSGKIGGEAFGGEYFHGIIDEVRLHARPLSAAEIRQLYLTTATRTTAVPSTAGRDMRIEPDPNEDRIEIDGIVRRPDGTPVANVPVNLLVGGRGTTDSAGRYTIAYSSNHMLSLAKYRQNCRLFVRDPERDLAAAVAVPSGVDQTTDITLARAVTVIGRVTSPDGEPIAGARVVAVLCDDSWGAYLGACADDLRIRTNAQGVFQIKTVPRGCFYELAIRAEGYGIARREFGIWDARTSCVDLGDIKLAQANLSVSGRVVDANDRPVRGATVRLTGPGQPNHEADSKSDVEGLFAIDGACPGRVELKASVEDEDGSLAFLGRADGFVPGGPVKIVVEPWLAVCGPPGPGPWSLRGKPLPALDALQLDIDENDLRGKEILLCFWREDTQRSRHFIQKLIYMTPELAQHGFAVLAVRVPVDGDWLVCDSLRQTDLPFPSGRLPDSDECLRGWGFPVSWLPWLIVADRDRMVTAEDFALKALRDLPHPGGEPAR